MTSTGCGTWQHSQTATTFPWRDDMYGQAGHGDTNKALGGASTAQCCTAHPTRKLRAPHTRPQPKAERCSTSKLLLLLRWLGIARCQETTQPLAQACMGTHTQTDTHTHTQAIHTCTHKGSPCMQRNCTLSRQEREKRTGTEAVPHMSE